MWNRKLKRALVEERERREVAEREARELRDQLDKATRYFYEYRQHDWHREYIKRLQKRIAEFDAGYEDARLDDSRARTEAFAELSRVLQEDVEQVIDGWQEHGPQGTQ